VPLAPLADGTAGMIQPGGVGAQPIYVPSAEETPLLSRATDLCIDRAADASLTARMETLAGTGALNLKPVDEEVGDY